MEYESLVVVLSLGSARLDGGELHELTDTRVLWSRVESEGRASCLAARIRHRDTPDRFRDRVRGWGRARGWAVTVAPGAPSC